MQKVLVATTNKGKLAEIREYLSDLPLEFVSLSDLGITQEVIEDGNTYQENSQKKAVEYARLSGIPAISDDGGLEIDALGGQPGVNSKYWAGPEGRDEDLIAKMSDVSKNLPEHNRNAVFRAVVSFALPNGDIWSEEGQTSLIIAKEPLLKLLKGFPFRSFLYIPQIGKYYHESELTQEERKEYNHRHKALMKLKKTIQEKLEL